MHEALITKGMVRGNKHADKINSRQNCVIRHNVCPDGQMHNPGIGSEWDYVNCLRQIIKFEGYESVVVWLMQMKDYFPTVADEALQRVMFTDIEVFSKEKRNGQS